MPPIFLLLPVGLSFLEAFYTHSNLFLILCILIYWFYGFTRDLGSTLPAPLANLPSTKVTHKGKSKLSSYDTEYLRLVVERFNVLPSVKANIEVLQANVEVLQADMKKLLEILASLVESRNPLATKEEDDDEAYISDETDPSVEASAADAGSAIASTP